MKIRKIAVSLAAGLAVLLGGCDQYRDVKDTVSRTMLDPESTRFRNVETCDADSTIIHGEVSGKNVYGAHDGFQPFFYSKYRVAFARDSEFSDLLNRCYKIIALPTATATPSASAAAVPVGTKPAAQSKRAPGEPMDHYTAEDEAALEAAMAKTSSKRCWQDYCPCDTSDPDYGGADVTICRNLKGGIPVEDAMFAVGAAFRDGRRQMREARVSY